MYTIGFKTCFTGCRLISSSSYTKEKKHSKKISEQTTVNLFWGKLLTPVSIATELILAGVLSLVENAVVHRVLVQSGVQLLLVKVVVVVLLLSEMPKMVYLPFFVCLNTWVFPSEKIVIYNTLTRLHAILWILAFAFLNSWTYFLSFADYVSDVFISNGVQEMFHLLKQWSNNLSCRQDKTLNNESSIDAPSNQMTMISV